MFPTFQGAFLFLSAGIMLYLLMDLLSTLQCVGLCKSIFQRCLCECTCISPQSTGTPGISAQVKSDEGQIETKLSFLLTQDIAYTIFQSGVFWAS